MYYSISLFFLIFVFITFKRLNGFIASTKGANSEYIAQNVSYHLLPPNKLYNYVASGNIFKKMMAKYENGTV